MAKTNPIALAFGGQLGLAKDLPQIDVTPLMKKAEKEAAARAARVKQAEDAEKANDELAKLLQVSLTVGAENHRARLGADYALLKTDFAQDVMKYNRLGIKMPVDVFVGYEKRMMGIKDKNDTLKAKEDFGQRFEPQLKDPNSIYNAKAQGAFYEKLNDYDSTIEDLNKLASSNLDIVNRDVVIDNFIKQGALGKSESRKDERSGVDFSYETYSGIIKRDPKTGKEQIGADGRPLEDWSNAALSARDNPHLSAMMDERKVWLSQNGDSKKPVGTISDADALRHLVRHRVPLSTSRDVEERPAGGSQTPTASGFSAANSGGVERLYKVVYDKSKKSFATQEYTTASLGAVTFQGKDARGNPEPIKISLSNVQGFPIGGAMAGTDLDSEMQNLTFRGNADVVGFKIMPMIGNSIVEISDQDVARARAIVSKQPAQWSDADKSDIDRITRQGKVKFVLGAEVSGTTGARDVSGAATAAVKKGMTITDAEEYRKAVVRQYQANIAAGESKAHDTYFVPLERIKGAQNAVGQITTGLGYSSGGLTTFNSPYIGQTNRQSFLETNRIKEMLNNWEAKSSAALPK